MRVNGRESAIDSNDGRLSRLSSDRSLFSVYGKMQFLSSFREEILIRKRCLNGGVRHCQFAVIIDLGLYSVERYKDEIIGFFIETDANSNRRHHQRIMRHLILLGEDDILHDFLPPKRHTLFRYSQPGGDCLGIPRHTTASADDKDRLHRSVSI